MLEQKISSLWRANRWSRLLVRWGPPTLFWGAYVVFAARRSHRPARRPTTDTAVPHVQAATSVPLLPATDERAADDRSCTMATVQPVAAGERLLLQVDGTPGYPGGGVAGLGIVVRSARGHVLRTRCFRATAYTNNEAEYQALIAGLSFVLRAYPGRAIRCMSDSKVAIDQLCGRATVRGTLQPLYAQAHGLAAQFADLELVAIPRELNQLADALAWEALSGRGRILRFRMAPSGTDESQV